MELIKQILIDSMNGFSLKFLPLFLFQLLVAGLLGHLIQKIMNRKFGSSTLQKGALIALAVALLSGIVKYSLPFAVLAAALLLYLRPSRDSAGPRVVGLFLAALAGVGCGVGSVFQTVAGFVLVALVILFTPVKSSE